MAPALFGRRELDVFTKDLLPPPSEKPRRVAIGFGTDQDGIKFVANFTSTETATGWQWKLQTAYRHNWIGDDSVGAFVQILK